MEDERRHSGAAQNQLECRMRLPCRGFDSPVLQQKIYVHSALTSAYYYEVWLEKIDSWQHFLKAKNILQCTLTILRLQGKVMGK
jgi:hypothetical protein